MRKGNKKKEWGKPKLIILTRGKLEERLLSVARIHGINSVVSAQLSLFHNVTQQP